MTVGGGPKLPAPLAPVCAGVAGVVGYLCAAMNLVRLAAILGFVGVALGAFGAHALRGHVAPELIEVWKTGVLYQMIHVLALLGTAALGTRVGRPGLVAGFFLAGIALFSGSLYTLVLTGQRGWGAVTPAGGAAFMAGWIALAICNRRG
jgi:uncharacterized membrane protein YgdD (TMEM256/DUF423 family)